MRHLKSSVVLLLFVILLLGCQSDKSSSVALPAPFDTIPIDFEFRVFEIPSEWEVVILSEHFPVKTINTGKVKLEEQPNEIRLVFGEKSKTNDYNLAEINKEEQERNADYKTLYIHSEENRIAEMSIMKIQDPVHDEKNALEDTIFQSFAEMPYFQVGDREVYYYIIDGKENPMFYLWFSEDKKYRYSFGHIDNEILTIDDTLPFLEKLIKEK